MGLSVEELYNRKCRNLLKLIFCYFVCSTFLRNEGETGAISSHRFPITLQGQNQWIRNSMSAIVLIDSNINCMGDILFMENRGINGGAIQMNGNSIVC